MPRWQLQDASARCQEPVSQLPVPDAELQYVKDAEAVDCCLLEVKIFEKNETSNKKRSSRIFFV